MKEFRNKINFDGVKKGDTVTIFSTESRDNNVYPKEVTVLSKGKKYITVSDMHVNVSKFSIENGYCKDWTQFYLYPGSILLSKNSTNEKTFLTS